MKSQQAVPEFGGLVCGRMECKGPCSTGGWSIIVYIVLSAIYPVHVNGCCCCCCCCFCFFVFIRQSLKIRCVAEFKRTQGCCFFVGHPNKALDQKAVNTFIDAEELQKATTFRSSWQLFATQDFDPRDFFRKLCFFDVVLERTCPDNGMRGCTQADSGSCFIRSRSIRYSKTGSFAEAFAKRERHYNAGVKEVQGWMSALVRAIIYSVGIHKIIRMMPI